MLDAVQDRSRTVCRPVPVQARLLEECLDPAEVFSLHAGDETRHVTLADILSGCYS